MGRRIKSFSFRLASPEDEDVEAAKKPLFSKVEQFRYRFWMRGGGRERKVIYGNKDEFRTQSDGNFPFRFRYLWAQDILDTPDESDPQLLGHVESEREKENKRKLKFI